MTAMFSGSATKNEFIIFVLTIFFAQTSINMRCTDLLIDDGWMAGWMDRQMFAGKPQNEELPLPRLVAQLCLVQLFY